MCIEITCIYDRVTLLIHVDTCSTCTIPSPTKPVLQTSTLTPHPLYKQPWARFRLKNYSDLMVMLLFLAFLFSIFISGGVFFCIFI